MDSTLSFRFVDNKLNRRFISLLKRKDINHCIDTNGSVHYSLRDEESVENDVVGSIRSEVFPSWQVLSCPKDWTEAYKEYMTQHGIPFREESINDELCFLIPGKCRPHSWKLGEPGPRKSNNNRRLKRA